MSARNWTGRGRRDHAINPDVLGAAPSVKVGVTHEMLAQLDARARATYRTRAEVVRELLAQGLAS